MKEHNKLRVLAKYKITYSNGFIQNKNLVSAEDWNNIIKPIKKAISIIEDDNKGKENQQSKLLKSSLNLMFENINICFPEQSPLHNSIKTGLLELGEYQGNHKVLWKRIQ